MRSRNLAMRNDDGVSLVLALVFIVIVALFATVALDKAASTSVAGQTLRERGDVQYALDGAVDRAFQVLKDDVAGATVASPATICSSPPATPGTAVDITQESGGFVLNGQSVTYSCETLAGTTAAVGDTVNTNFAVILTGTTTNALTTSAGIASGQNATCASPGATVKLGGSVFLSGVVNDTGVSKRVLVCGGDLVARYAGCTDGAVKAATNLITEASFLKTCTEQDLDEAVVDVALPAAPSVDLGATYVGMTGPLYQDIVTGSGNPQNAATCRVFFPGKYRSMPALRTQSKDANYFVSGLYAFQFANNAAEWQVGANTSVTAGQPQTGDVTASGGSTACASVISGGDAALINGLGVLLTGVTGLTPGVITGAFFPTGGATFVLEGPSRIDVQGRLTINSTADAVPLSLVAARGTSDPGQEGVATDVTRGYAPWSGGSNPVIRNQSATSGLVLNGKLMAPSAPVELFASNPTEGVARAGVVAKTLDIAASVQGGGLAISTPASSSNPAPPPFRTVRITSSTGSTTATNVAVATISNYAPFTVTVKSWRTG